MFKRRVGRLAYELKLPPEWRVHPMISVARLEPTSDAYNRPKPDHPNSVKIEENTENNKSYEVEKNSC